LWVNEQVKHHCKYSQFGYDENELKI
jgi:hypothetical protein